MIALGNGYSPLLPPLFLIPSVWARTVVFVRHTKRKHRCDLRGAWTPASVSKSPSTFPSCSASQGLSPRHELPTTVRHVSSLSYSSCPTYTLLGSAFRGNRFLLQFGTCSWVLLPSSLPGPVADCPSRGLSFFSVPSLLYSLWHTISHLILLSLFLSSLPNFFLKKVFQVVYTGT